MRETLVVCKLGGAAITDKRTQGAVCARGFEDGASAIARAVAFGVDDVILVHGAGSFGHGATLFDALWTASRVV